MGRGVTIWRRGVKLLLKGKTANSDQSVLICAQTVFSFTSVKIVKVIMLYFLVLSIYFTKKLKQVIGVTMSISHEKVPGGKCEERIQLNFNVSNTFGTMKICSRQGYSS